MAFEALIGLLETGAGARTSYDPCCFSVGASSDSASSAQLGTEPLGAVGGTEFDSLEGVVVPEEGLLGVAWEDTEVDMPFAACAYEKGTGAAETSLPERREVAIVLACVTSDS